MENKSIKSVKKFLHSNPQLRVSYEETVVYQVGGDNPSGPADKHMLVQSSHSMQIPTAKQIKTRLMEDVRVSISQLPEKRSQATLSNIRCSAGDSIFYVSYRITYTKPHGLIVFE